MSLTRQQILDTLQSDWGTYVQRFQAMSVPAQAVCLEQQGYARLGDLLAHVIAWWEVGQWALATLAVDPAFHEQDYDVHAFNAAAVERFSQWDEPAILAAFEAQRATMVDLVTHLPEAAFQNQKMLDRLHIEFVGHLQEHALPAGG